MTGLIATVALTGGCTSGSPAKGSRAAGSSSSASAQASPTPGRTSASQGPYAANTRDVCGAINAAIAEGVLGFGTDLGTMVGHQDGGNASAAAQAKASAVKHLTDTATKVRTAAKPAQDPAVRAAADATADRFDQYAKDPNLLAGVKTGADVTPLLTKVTQAADPLQKVCV